MYYRCINREHSTADTPQQMEEVSLHSRAWDALEEELEHDIAEYDRYGRQSRADDLRHALNQIRDQRRNGCDPEGADLNRYADDMAESLGGD